MKFKELFKDALPLITKFAPSIAGAIGGPVGIAAGYVVPILANAFGTHPTNIAGLVQQIVSDPNTQGKLEALEVDHGDWIESLLDTTERLTSAEINIKLGWSEQK
jgi:hypothetical protein